MSILARMELSETLKQVQESLHLERFWRIKNERCFFFGKRCRKVFSYFGGVRVWTFSFLSYIFAVTFAFLSYLGVSVELSTSMVFPIRNIFSDFDRVILKTIDEFHSTETQTWKTDANFITKVASKIKKTSSSEGAKTI